jgi:hypothetical protein
MNGGQVFLDKKKVYSDEFEPYEYHHLEAHSKYEATKLRSPQIKSSFTKDDQFIISLNMRHSN